MALWEGALGMGRAPITLTAPKERPAQLLTKFDPEIQPASSKDTMAALERLTSGGGAPRWAAVGWCVDLAGPRRSISRVADDGDSSDRALGELIDRINPEPSTEVLPRWLRGRSGGDVDVLLELGVASGKPGRRWRCEVPPEVRPVVVELVGDDGWVRYRHPNWVGSALASDGRLQGLAELCRWRGDYPERTADVATLVGWVAGPGRADIGAWIRSHPSQGVIAESSSATARVALPRFTECAVDDVVAQVLAAAA